MQAMIRYRLKREQVQPQLGLIHGYLDELAELRPEGLREAVYQLEDGVSFVHLVDTGDAGVEVFAQLPAFQRARAALDERCEEPPVVTLLGEVGGYGFGTASRP